MAALLADILVPCWMRNEIHERPWTRGTFPLSDEGVWTRTQRLVSRVLVIAGLVLIVGGIIGGRDGWILLMTIVVVAALVPHVYSYFDYRKTHHRQAG